MSNDYWRPSGAPVAQSTVSSSELVAAPKSVFYLSLAREGQHFVDTIRVMGFDETDVARAVHELGVDDKQVIC